jgi:hypothetical protein
MIGELRTTELQLEAGMIFAMTFLIGSHTTPMNPAGALLGISRVGVGWSNFLNRSFMKLKLLACLSLFASQMVAMEGTPVDPSQEVRIMLAYDFPQPPPPPPPPPRDPNEWPRREAVPGTDGWAG